MSGENVISLNGVEIDNKRRAVFLQTIAESYDLYVSRYNEEPDAVVFVLCGLRQTSQIAWHVCGDSAGGTTSVLSLAAMHCLAEAQSDRTTEF